MLKTLHLTLCSLLSCFVLALLLPGCSKQPAATSTVAVAVTVSGGEPTSILTDVTISAETTPTPENIQDLILTFDADWTQIKPGGETRCAHDTEFSFWAKPATTNKLLVYFQGGGGCWSGDTCQFGSNFYDASAGASDSPARRGGVLDFNNPDNLFADYHAVYVPSCTDNIYHHGFVNLNAATE